MSLLVDPLVVSSLGSSVNSSVDHSVRPSAGPLVIPLVIPLVVPSGSFMGPSWVLRGFFGGPLESYANPSWSILFVLTISPV